MASGEIQDTACKVKFHCFISCSKCTPRDSKGKLQRSSRHSVFRHFSERHVTNTCNIGVKDYAYIKMGNISKGKKGEPIAEEQYLDGL